MSGCGEKSFTSLGEEATTMNTRKWFFQGLSDSASWHAKFANSAYVFAGGLSFDLTVLGKDSQDVDVNLVRHEETGKSRGFAFVCYEDQRSTVLVVDNLNGGTVLGRTIRVEHVDDYRLKDEEAAKRKDWIQNIMQVLLTSKRILKQQPRQTHYQ